MSEVVRSGARLRTARRVLGWAIVAVAVLVPCATVGNPAAAHGETARGTAQSPGPALPALPLVSAQVATQPADGAAGVTPTAPVGVTVSQGTLDTVALTNPAGKAVAGRLAEDRKSWASTEPLGYDKTYTWSGTSIGVDGQHRPITGSFRTLAPAHLVGAQINIADGSTYGVAMPIALTFTSPVTDKAAVQRALSVQTSVPTEGSWAWLSDSTVHWRPKNYFAPGTKVNVVAKLYGLAMGNGAFGGNDLTSNFTVGRSYVLRGDTRTHRLLAFSNGAQVADYPASYGLDTDPGRATHSGTHVVMRKYAVYFMNNPKYDYQNVEAHWAVRISNNGEFTHSAPWSVRQQGNSNVSHGCVNLAPDNAKAVFDAVLPGDPVEIVGSSQQLSGRDGDYYDWAVPWQTWVAKSALH